MDFTFTSQLHYLVHQVDGEEGHVAHCLDLDLVGSGNSVDDAVNQLNDLVRGVVYYCIKAGVRDTSMHCSRAPQSYWDMFQEACDANECSFKTLDVNPDISPVNIMECHFTYNLAIAYM